MIILPVVRVITLRIFRSSTQSRELVTSLRIIAPSLTSPFPRSSVFGTSSSTYKSPLTEKTNVARRLTMDSLSKERDNLCDEIGRLKLVDKVNCIPTKNSQLDGGIKRAKTLPKLSLEKPSAKSVTKEFLTSSSRSQPQSPVVTKLPPTLSRNRLPKDWEHLKPIGAIIPGTRFVCFKTPFDTVVSYPKGCDIFTTSHLLERAIKLNINLGMVVDLTDTDRYYKPSMLEKAGVRSLKIRVPGKGVPSQAAFDLFEREVNRFLADPKETRLIGVHCTHGINRTGWFVCRYLMRKMNWSAEVAMERFNEARGHAMYRMYLVDNLRQLCTKSKVTKCEADDELYLSDSALDEEGGRTAS